MNKILFRILRFWGIPALFREIVQKDKVTIVLFHDISKETAQKTFSLLKKKYNIIGLDDYILARKNNDFSMIPPKAMIITFDDGHIRNYEMLPVIRELEIPVTIFLCASIINTHRHFWFLDLKDAQLISTLKRVSNKNRLEQLLSKIGYRQDREYVDIQALQDNHIKEMKPFINFQAHTLFHPILPACDDAEAESEIFLSKKILEKDFNLSINTISYPNGDYSERDIVLSEKAGYACGITVDFGFNTPKTDIFRLKRLPMNDTDDMNELIVKVSGVWGLLKTRNGRKQKCGLMETIIT